MRGAGAEATVRRESRRTPDPGRGGRLGGEQRRRECGVHRTQRPGAGTGDRERAGARRRSTLFGGLSRGARDRNSAGRSDRSAGGGLGVRAGPVGGSSAPDRLGEDECGASGGGGRGRGRNQGAPVDARGSHSETSELRGAESRDRLGGAPGAGHDGGGAVARRSQAAPAGGGELLRVLGDERPSADRGVPGRGGQRGVARGSGGRTRGVGGVARGTELLGAGGAPPAALGAYGPCPARAGGPVSLVAEGRCAAWRLGLDGGGGPEPFRLPGGRRLPGTGGAPGAARGARAERRAGGGRRGSAGREGGLPLHRPGQPVDGDGPRAVRERAGRARGPGPVRGGVPGGAGRVAVGRHVRGGRRNGSARPDGMGAARPLRAGERTDRSVGERRRASRRGLRAQRGRDCGRARGGRLRSRGGSAVRGAAWGAHGLAPCGRGDGGGLRAPRAGGGGAFGAGLAGGGQRGAPGGERSGGRDRRARRRIRRGGDPGRAAAHQPRLPQRPDGPGARRSGGGGARGFGAVGSAGGRCERAFAGWGSRARVLASPGARAGPLRYRDGHVGGAGGRDPGGDRPARGAGADGVARLAGRRRADGPPEPAAGRQRRLRGRRGSRLRGRSRRRVRGSLRRGAAATGIAADLSLPAGAALGLRWEEPG